MVDNNWPIFPSWKEREAQDDNSDLDKLRLQQALARIAELDAERDALKCCGNCKHLFLSGYEFDRSCDEWEYASIDIPKGGYVECYDHCHFNPPRWVKREGGE